MKTVAVGRKAGFLAGVVAMLLCGTSSVRAYEAGLSGNDNGSKTNTVISDEWTSVGSINATSIGWGSEIGTSSNGGVAIGADAKIKDNSMSSAAVGNSATVEAGSQSSVAVGGYAKVGAGSQESTAVGQGANIGANSYGSVALGHGATVAADTARGIAIGDYSNVLHDNSVALGAESQTTRGAQSYYTAYGLDAPQNSVGEVAIGDKNGGLRTLTGLAAGQEATDAVNVSQLEAVDKFTVKYDAVVGDPSTPNYSAITLGAGAVGDAPVVIDNVSAGRIASDSYQAVNGSQVHAVSSSVASALGGGSTVNPDGTISAPSYTVQGQSYSDVGSAFSGVDSSLYAVNGRIDGVDQQIGTINQHLGQLDNQVAALDEKLNVGLSDAMSEAHQAAAIGLAASSLRFDDRAGKFSVAASGGYWQDEGAFALGAGYTSLDQRVRANVNAATSGGNWGAGGGLSFTLN